MRPRALFRIAFACSLAALLGACASGGGARTPASDDTSVPVAAEAAPSPVIADAASDTVADTRADSSTAPGDAPTQAEDDHAAIYGADTDARAPGERHPQDPWEPFNRRVHHFNNGVDRVIAKPLARAYIAVAPPPVRMGVGNFFSNLGQPVSALNALLQGRPKQAGQSLARFSVNFTLGVLGIFDPATNLGIPNRSEDFGQTLARWGWHRSRYLVLPLLGPRTLRDALGGAVEVPLSPLQQIEEDRVRVFLQGLQLVDLRTNLLAADSLREGVYDDYALTRDAWLQRRNYQIDSRNGGRDASLPLYLQDDSTPDDTVPANQPAQPQPAQ